MRIDTDKLLELSPQEMYDVLGELLEQFDLSTGPTSDECPHANAGDHTLIKDAATGYKWVVDEKSVPAMRKQMQNIVDIFEGHADSITYHEGSDGT